MEVNNGSTSPERKFKAQGPLAGSLQLQSEMYLLRNMNENKIDATYLPQALNRTSENCEKCEHYLIVVD